MSTLKAIAGQGAPSLCDAQYLPLTSPFPCSNKSKSEIGRLFGDREAVRRVDVAKARLVTRLVAGLLARYCPI